MRWTELTSRASGGVSVLLLSGAGALDAIRRLAPGARLVAGTPTLARLVVGGELLDEALICVHAEDRVELHCHGSPPLVRRLGRELGGGELRGRASGAPGAECEMRVDDDPHPSRAARDQVQRAWAWLPRAHGESAARMLLDQAEGALERELESLFEQPSDVRERGLRLLDQRSRTSRFLLAPPRLLLAGPVNAGKSTLFNVLLGTRRAITSDQAGTTRDLLREPTQLAGWPVWLIDSAGDRELAAASSAGQSPEVVGQALGRRERATADLTLWLQPPGAPAPPAPADGEVRVVVPSRGDLPEAAPDALRPLEDPEEARQRVAALLREACDLPTRAWVPGAGVRLPRA